MKWRSHRLADHLWIPTSIVVASVVVLAYLVTHSHPAYEGGLYLQMAEAIVQSGWRLPMDVPGYTTGGIPFAYPPLLFYVLGIVMRTTGLDPVALQLYLPGLITIAYLVPYWFIASEILPTRRQVGLATVLFAVTPAVLQWHISAGGIVRSIAMFLTLTGLYSGIKLFKTGKRRWLIASTVLFGLVVLSHPVYAAYFGLSYLLLYLCLDRSAVGLARGGVVAIGGLAIASPWWLTVVDRYAFETLLGATRTRSSIGGGLTRIVRQFVHPITVLEPQSAFYVGAFTGALYALRRRRFLLPLWLVLGSYGIGADRFTFVAGSMLTAMVLFELVLPSITDRLDRAPSRGVAAGGVIAIVVLSAGIVGVAYAGGALNTAHVNSSTMPQTVDPADRAAMDWVEGNTSNTADFAVVGDSAEWFPYYANRTILVSPWGTEWTSPGEFRRNLVRYVALSSCDSARCLEGVLQYVSGSADYVYVPSEAYTVRGKERAAPGRLLESLRDSAHFEQRYENEGVVIFEVDGAPGHRAAPPDMSGASAREGNTNVTSMSLFRSPDRTTPGSPSDRPSLSQRRDRLARGGAAGWTSL